MINLELCYWENVNDCDVGWDDLRRFVKSKSKKKVIN